MCAETLDVTRVCVCVCTVASVATHTHTRLLINNMLGAFLSETIHVLIRPCVKLCGGFSSPDMSHSVHCSLCVLVVKENLVSGEGLKVSTHPRLIKKKVIGMKQRENVEPISSLQRYFIVSGVWYATYSLKHVKSSFHLCLINQHLYLESK